MLRFYCSHITVTAGQENSVTKNKPTEGERGSARDFFVARGKTYAIHVGLLVVDGMFHVDDSDPTMCLFLGHLVFSKEH